MEAWMDFEAAIEAEREQRARRAGQVATLTTGVVLVGALWLAWPGLEAVMAGEGAPFAVLGLPALVLLCGTLVHDHASGQPQATGRAAAAAAIAWPSVLFLAFRSTDAELEARIAAGLTLALIAGVLYSMAKTAFSGGFRQARYRALLTGAGAVTVASVWFGLRTDVGAENDLAGAIITLLAIGTALRSWLIEDEQRGLRKRFRIRLDDLENRLLELKAQGRRVDQATSLVRTAAMEGFSDPEHGMRLLDDAEEDVDRTISLEKDVVAIEADALSAVEKAEAVAPTVRRPRSAFDAARREVELGSLREGESLFRQAKRRAETVVAWWARAQEAIEAASLALANREEEHLAQLHEALAEAKKRMAKEDPLKAFELVMAIPDQVAQEQEANEDAEGLVADARRAVEAADGLDLEPHHARLEEAEDALKAGDGRQAAGIAESIRRSLTVEREAMDVVRRALRQRSTIEQRFEGHEDTEGWLEKLASIEADAEARRWTQARRALDELSHDLDAQERDRGEAEQLLDFLREEWKQLRAQVDAADIGVGDEDRLDVERLLGTAASSIKRGMTAEALEALTGTDAAMERLRRRC
ncbi:MAG TPA: hypothetical protein D7I05_04035 [Candidatus Poseidoniales archaeon]|nr:MAG TPA: hypothetical protein D7I05_04035 [Candidatus Poseidoniales archaeon]